MGAILEEASMRGFVALGTVVVLLIGTAPAIAKGAGSVEVVGHDVKVGDSSFGIVRLQRAARFYDSLFRTDGPVVAAPAGSRGPRDPFVRCGHQSKRQITGPGAALLCRPWIFPAGVMTRKGMPGRSRLASNGRCSRCRQPPRCLPGCPSSWSVPWPWRFAVT